ncbi:hypothetical protein BJ944DRAFT_271362 [Cunninghamella echinulata]|nr:hypothetical protein BJ944DRAFT_271362 [Cunninghamella echinulata]
MTYMKTKIAWLKTKPIIVYFTCIPILCILVLLSHRKQITTVDTSTYYHKEKASWPVQINDASINSLQSLYTPSMFIPDALKTNHFYPLTAVIVRTNKDLGVYHIVQHLYKYPFIKEIIIYNLLPSQSIPSNIFDRPDQWLIHKVKTDVINATSEEDHDGMLSLFTTCGLASFSHCYIQSDRTLNPFMDTLYTHFMKYPTLLHVNTRSQDYKTHKRWQLYHQDEDMDLHFGYANIQHGAILPRKMAIQFTNQLSMQEMVHQQRRMADVFFSFWTNSYPWLLSNPLPLVDKQPLPYHQMLNAVRRFEKALKNKTPYFNQGNSIEPALHERDVKTSCGNDKCLFVTNIDPFPLSTEYRPEQNLTNSSLGSSLKWEEEFDLDLPSSEYLVHRGYHAAVDGNSGTCWNTYLVPKAGNYFGLDIVGTIRVSRLLMYTRQPLKDPGQAFRVIVQLQDNNWNDCQLTMDEKQTIPRRTVYQMNCPDRMKPIKAIRIFFNHDHDTPFDLCGLGLDNFIV